MPVPSNVMCREMRELDMPNDGSRDEVEATVSDCLAMLAAELSGVPYNKAAHRCNLTKLLAEVVSDRLAAAPQLLNVAAADADQPIVVPEVNDILSILASPPTSTEPPDAVHQRQDRRSFSTNYFQREARGRSLGSAGEEFVLKGRERQIEVKTTEYGRGTPLFVSGGLGATRWLSASSTLASVR